MSGLRNVIEVARREVVVRGRSRAYIVATVLMAVALSVLISLPALVGDDDDPAGPSGGPAIELGIVGETDDLVEVGLEAVTRISARQIERTPVADVATARLAVQDRELRLALDLTGVSPVVIGRPPAFVSEADGLAAFVADTLARTRALQVEGLDDEAILRSMTYAPVEVAVAADGDLDDSTRRGGLAYGGMLFLYTTLLIYGTWVVNGVIEEKSNRVVEVLLATVRPRDLMAGKVLGLGTLGITQVLAVVAPALVTSAVVGDSFIPRSATVPVLGIVAWWVLGFMLFAGLMAAMGSLIQRPEDAQSATFPVVILVLAGLFLAMAALENPNGTLAVVGSFIPFTAPMVMVVRTTLGEAAVWEVALAALSIFVGGVATTRLAGRIYAGAILRTRGKVKLREAWRAGA